MTHRTELGRYSSHSLKRSLWATIVGVNLLIILGATNALADAAAVCPEWPICHDIDLGNAGIWLAIIHRGTVVLVTGMLAMTVLQALRSDAHRYVKRSLAIAAVLWPIQVAIGAGVAMSGASSSITGIHLITGGAVLLTLVASLAWHLEKTSDPDDLTGTRRRKSSTSPSAGKVQAYLRLMKPRLMWLLCLVAIAAMVLAAGGLPNAWTALGTLLGGVLAIGASGAFNHVLERDRDQRMARTANRPLATGMVSPTGAITFGGILTLASLVSFLSLTNVVAAALALGAIGFYGVGYTILLKPRTTQNIVIGGAVGAFPALIGWAAVTGSIGLPAIVLGGVIFLWTPAHFYNLALAYVEDYRAADLPMVPVVRGTGVALRDIVGYLGATFVATGVLAAITSLSWLVVLPTVFMGAVFLWTVLRVHEQRTQKAAMRAFHASNAYLGLVLLAVILNGVV